MLTTALIVLSALAAAADEETTTQVRRLVRQLDAGDVASRDAAEKGLVELGPRVLDVLDQFSPPTSVEVRRRLENVREALYKKIVESATLEATVTLQAEEMPLSKVLAAINQQTGNRIVDKREEFGQVADDVKITADFKDTPYWEALDAVLDQAGMTTYNYSGETGATAIISRQRESLSRQAHTAYSGIFRFEPTQIEAIRDLRNPANAALKLYVEVAWEPRTTPIALAQSLSALRLTDENGKSLEMEGRLGTVEADVNSSMSATEMEFPIALPPRSIEKIASLAGELKVLVPGRVESFTFDNLAKAKDDEQKKASATVIVQGARKNGDVYEVRMVLRFDKAANALESHRSWVLTNDAYLLDTDGQRVDHAGYETIRQTVNEVGFSYKFVIDDGIENYKFVYKTPAAVVEKQIKYELKDISLP